MEKSILQDKITGAGVTKRLASASAVIDYGQLSQEYDAKKATDPVYDEDYGLGSYLQDTWHNFTDKRLSTSIDEERGKLALDVYPKQRNIDAQLKHLEAKDVFEQLNSKLNATPVDDPTYVQLREERNAAYEAYQQTVSGYGAIIAANGVKPYEDLVKERQSLTEKESEHLTAISEYKEDLDENSQYKISDTYKNKEAEAMDKAELGDPDFWKYALPGTMGSSMTSWEAQAANMIYNTGVSALAIGGIIGAPFTAGASLGATAAAAGLYTGGVAMSVGTNIYSRNEESMANVFDAKRGKVLADLGSQKIDEGQLANMAREQLKSKEVDDTKYTDKELSDMVISGEISLPDPNINQVLQGAESGLQDLYEKNMSGVVSDVAQDALTFLPVAKAIKVVSKGATNVVKKSKQMRKLIEAPSKVRDFNNRVLRSTGGRIKAVGALKTAGAIALTGLLEGMEEASQQVYQQQYNKGDRNNSVLSNALSIIPAYGEVASVLTGIDTTSKLANDKEFYQNFNSGVALGLFMGGPVMAGQRIAKVGKEAKATNYMNQVVANQIDDKDTFNKASLYTNKAINNKQGELIEAMEAYKSRLPEGVTPEMMDEEIKHASHVFGMANNKHNVAFAKQLGVDKNSADYGHLIGLQDYMYNKTKELTASSSELNKTYNEAINKTFSESLPLPDRYANRAAEGDISAKLQIEKNIINDLLEEANTVPGFSKISPYLLNELAERNKAIDNVDFQATKTGERAYDNAFNTLSNSTEVNNLFRGKLLNDAALDYYFNRLNDVAPSENKSEDEINEVKSLLKSISDGKRETFDILKSNLVRNNEAVNKAKAEEDAAIVEQAMSEKDAAKVDNTEIPSVEPPAVVPTVESGITPITNTSQAVEQSVIDTIEPEDTSIPEPVAPAEPAKPTTTTNNKSVEQQRPVTPTSSPIDNEVIGVDDSYADDDYSYDDESDDSLDEGVEDLGKKSTDKTEKPSKASTNKAIRTAEKIASAMAPISDQLPENIIAMLEQSNKSILAKEYEEFNLWSDVMFYQPDSTTPMDIVVDGKKIDVLPGAELKKAVENEDFLDTASFEYAVGDGNKTVEDAAIYVIIDYNGNKYAAAFRLPKTAENNIAARLAYFDANVKGLNEEIKQILTAEYAKVIAKLRDNRQSILFAWNGKDANESIVPVTVTKSDGTINAFNTNKRRPVQKIKGLLSGKVNQDNTVVGISDGTHGKFQTYNVADGSNMGNVGGNGDVFLYPTSPSGKRIPVLVHKQKVGAYSGFPELIFSALRSYGRDRFTHNGKVIFAPVKELLTHTIGFGEHTVLLPYASAQGTFDPIKQFDISGGYLTLGLKSYPISEIEANKDEIIAYIKDNINIRVAKDDVWNEVNQILPLEVMFAQTTANTIEFGPFKYTRDMAEEDSTTVGLDIILAANGLVSNVEDNLLTLQFMRANGVQTINDSQRANKATKPSPVTPTVVPTANDVADITNEKVLTDSIGSANASKEAVEQAKTTGYDPFADLMNGAFKRAKTTLKKVTEKEIQWLRNAVGLTEGEVVVYDTFLAGVKDGGMQAMGNMRHDCITISKLANKGVAYHEGFHRVSLLLLTDNERNRYYEMMAKRLGITTNTIREQKAIEEALADDFASFANNPFRHMLYPITKLFRRILRFVNIFGNKSDKQLSDLYSEIYNGKFASHEVNKASLERFKSIYNKDGAWFRLGGNEFSNISLKDYSEAVNSLVAAAFRINNIEMISDVNRLSLGDVKLFLSPENTAKFKLTEQQVAARKELYDSFDDVISVELKRQLAKYSIRAVDKEDENDANDVSNGDEVASDISSHVKSSVEISWRDNALMAAKLFIATIPALDVDGNNIVNQVTGLPTFVDFKRSWNKTLNIMHNVSTVDDVLRISAEQGEHDQFFKMFNRKLNVVKSEYVRTQLLNTLNTAYHNMVEVTYADYEGTDGKTTKRLFVNDANIKRASRELPLLWNGIFLERYFKTENEVQVVDKEKLSAAIAGYGRLLDLEKSLQIPYLTSILQSIGIEIDEKTLNNYLDTVGEKQPAEQRLIYALSFKDGISSLMNTFKDIATSTDNVTFKGKPIKFSSFLTGIDVLKQIATIHAKLNPNTAELSVIGPDNTLLYPISSHNYLSQITQRLNSDIKLIKDMLSVTYNSGRYGNRKDVTGSRLLSHLAKKGNKIQFNTFVSFKVDKTSDKGRKYGDLSVKEDYVMNAALSQQGHMILPTMGDSTTRNTVSGIPMFSSRGSFRLNAITNALEYVFNEEVTAQMWQYFKTELNTIVNNYANEKIVNAHPERKVANYHTGTRNGYRFRYFGQLTVDGVYRDFDAELKAAEDKGTTATLLKEIISIVDRHEDAGTSHQLMNDLLNVNFKEELEYANELEVITYDGDMSKVKNKALDQAVINEKSSQYKASTTAAKHAGATVDVIANYYANTIMSIIEFEKVYLKDPAYYKWKQDKKGVFTDKTVDKIKRIREVLSTGVIPRTDFDMAGKDGETEFTTATFNDVESSAANYDLIKNLATKSFAINLLREMHNLTDTEALKIYNSSEFKDAKYDNVRDALASRDGYFNKYGDGEVNQTDATVLISPAFYKQLIRRVDGWNDTLETAFQLLQDPSNKWMDNLEANMSAMALILKPLKFMYFGDHFDGELGLNVPVFDKMAMFPVFPAFVKDSDAQHFLNLMNERNIDMVAFDSAVKVGMKSSIDPYSKDANDETIINPKLGKVNTYKQRYDQLKRQLVTDPHHASRQMFVSQAFKAAMANIRPDRVYTLSSNGKQMTGTELKASITKSFNALTKQGYDRITSKFGIQPNSTDGFDINPDRLYKALWDNANNSNMNVNVLEGLAKQMPLSALSDNNWVESSLTSTFNKEIIDTRLPGGMFIQMSSIMYNNVTSDKHLQRKLNEVNEDGSMDAVISLNLLKHILPKDKQYTFSQARQWLMDNKVIGPDAQPTAIGYRIPAQGQASLSALKFVDVWPEQIGDTITLPDAFTTKTGSDKHTV